MNERHVTKSSCWRGVGLLIVAGTVVVICAAVPLLRESAMANERLKSVEAATALGARIQYAWQFDDKMGPTDVSDFAREFTNNPAFYSHVSHVDLTGSRFSDANLNLLEAFDQAKWIIVGDSDISDTGIAALSKKLPRCRIRR